MCAYRHMAGYASKRKYTGKRVVKYKARKLRRGGKVKTYRSSYTNKGKLGSRTSKQRNKSGLTMDTKIKHVTPTYSVGRGGGLNNSFKSPKGLLTAKNVYIEQSTNRIYDVTTNRAQAVAASFNVLDIPSLYGIKNSTTAQITREIPTVGITLPTSSLSGRVFLRTANVETYYVNQSSFSCSIDVYELVCLISQNQTITTTAPSLISAPTAWTKSINPSSLLASATIEIDYATPVTLVRPDIYDFAVSPTGFCKFWKILKKTTYSLQGGGTATHKSYHKINKVFDYSSIVEENAENQTNLTGYIKGLTVQTMVVVKGQPTNITGDGAIGVSQPEINSVTSVKYTFSGMPDSAMASTMLLQNINSQTNATAVAMQVDTHTAQNPTVA